MSSRKCTTTCRDWVLKRGISALLRRKALELSRLREFSRSDESDLEQELTLHLLQKLKYFNPARAQLATFASRVLKNKAASLIRAARAEKRHYGRNVQSLNDTIRDSDGKEVELAQTFEESAGRRHTGQRGRREGELAQLRIDISETNRLLPVPVKEVAALLSHVPQFAVSQVLGISRRQTARHITTLRELYEACGLVTR